MSLGKFRAVEVKVPSELVGGEERRAHVVRSGQDVSNRVDGPRAHGTLVAVAPVVRRGRGLEP